MRIVDCAFQLSTHWTDSRSQSGGISWVEDGAVEAKFDGQLSFGLLEGNEDAGRRIVDDRRRIDIGDLPGGDLNELHDRLAVTRLVLFSGTTVQWFDDAARVASVAAGGIAVVTSLESFESTIAAGRASTRTAFRGAVPSRDELAGRRAAIDRTAAGIVVVTLFETLHHAVSTGRGTTGLTDRWAIPSRNELTGRGTAIHWASTDVAVVTLFAAFEDGVPADRLAASAPWD
jgi:hypothetical protein